MSSMLSIIKLLSTILVLCKVIYFGVHANRYNILMCVVIFKTYLIFTVIFNYILYVIRNARRRPVAVSYKEESEKSDSDDYLEKEEVEEKEEEPPDTSETIEKVLAQRQGKKGVVGDITTIYAVEEKGDPNVECDPNDKETQYLIKWKNWSHIHNTWESMNSLQAQKVKGLKKIDNFIKREDAFSAAREQMTPEDAEYHECQLELIQDLVKSYNTAERIIGTN